MGEMSKTPEEIKKGLECAVDKKCVGKECLYFNEEYACIRMAQIDALALIQQLEAQVPKWISVEERLPEASGKYIVCTEKRSVYCTKFKAYGRGGNFQTDINTHITHWMLMPEPPKEGNNA